jgi:D-galactarolactone cycloisomerase
VKIRKIETIILRVPNQLGSFYSSQARFPERNSLLVRITSDDGLVGWGEGGQYGPPEPVATCIDDVIGPRLVGQRVDEPVRIWEESYSFSRDFGQKGTYVEAISAIDIALWDLWGKSLGRPIHALLGGAFRSEVHAYATGCYYGESYSNRAAMLCELEEEAATYVTSGFRTLKMKIGLLDIETDGERVRCVREAIGPDRNLLVDANHAYNPTNAIRMGRHLEASNVLWFEEPVVPEDRAGYRRVRDSLDVAIAGGEAEFTRYGFRDLLVGECVDIIQPDLCVSGGFSEFVKIHALASSFGVTTVPHVWGSGIALAAALQAIAAIPTNPHTYDPVPLQNEPVIEFDRKYNPLRDDLLNETFVLRDGLVSIPTGDGLGVTINEDKLAELAATDL